MAAEETALKVSHTGPLAKEISRPRGQSRLKGIPWKDKTDRRDFTRVYEYGYNRQEKNSVNTTTQNMCQPRFDSHPTFS